MKFDNAQHCFRSFVSFKNFSNIAFLNRVYTKFSVLWFVGTRWRKGALFGLLLGLIIPILELIYSAIIGAPAWSKPWPIAFALLAGPVAMSSVVFWFRAGKLVNPRRFGTIEASKISNNLMFDSSKVILGRVHASHVKQTLGKKLIHIGGASSQNLIEFDVAMSNHLLSGDIRILSEDKKKAAPHTEAEIISASNDDIDLQAKALVILTQNAIGSGSSFFNAKKISVRALSVNDGSGATCELGATSYFCSRVTNDLAAKCFIDIEGNVDDSPMQMFPSRIDKRKRVLMPFSETKAMSNHIGSMVLAVSKDGYPVLCYQKLASMENAGNAVLSGTGSLEYSDISHSEGNDTRKLGDVIRYGMARELLEETGGIAQDSHRKKDQQTLREYAKKIQLVGYYRDIRRGAFPIFVGFCRMSENFEAILQRKAEEPCWWSSAVETKVLKNLPDRVVDSPIKMLDYLEAYINPSQDVTQNKDIYRHASDQVLIVKELLRLKPVKEHFAKALKMGA